MKAVFGILSAALTGVSIGQFVVDPTLMNAINVGLSVVPFMKVGSSAFNILRFTRFKIGYFGAAKYWRETVRVGGTAQQMGRYFEEYVRMLLWIQRNTTKYFFGPPAKNVVPDYVFRTFRWFGRVEALGDAKYLATAVPNNPQTKGFIMAAAKEGADKFIFYVKPGGQIANSLYTYAKKYGIEIIKVEVGVP